MALRFRSSKEARRTLGGKAAKVIASTVAPVSPEDILSPPNTWGLNLEAEQQLSVEVYRALLEDRAAGLLRCVFSCVAAELPFPAWNAEMREMARTLGRKRKCMGVITGCPDWWFVWRDGGGVIELKTPAGEPEMRVVERAAGPVLAKVRKQPGRLSVEQRAFEQWCRSLATNHGVAHSVEEVRLLLDQWGARMF